MQTIVPHLWFNKEAKEAAHFYVSIFPNSKIKSINVLTGTPSGDCDVVSFELMGFSFESISAGPYFTLNPSISFMVNFDPSQDSEARTRIDEIWEKLSEGGKILMPLDAYPFSTRYGWIQDKYGVSWQLIFTDPEGEERPLIIPSLLFTEGAYGRAEEASNYYLSVFPNSQKGALAYYPEGMEPDKAGTVMFADFKLSDTWCAAMDSARNHGFTFNEAVSFMVKCDTQEEIDMYWDKLSAVPEAEQCGWCKDTFGVSWQIVPRALDEMMASGDKEKINRVTQAFLQMKKFDIKKLQEAAEGK